MTTEFIDVPRSFLRLLGIDIGVEKFKTGNTVALATTPFNFDRKPFDLVQRGEDRLHRQMIEICFPDLYGDIQQPNFEYQSTPYKYQHLFVWFRPILLEDCSNLSWIIPGKEAELECLRKLLSGYGEETDKKRFTAIVEWRAWVEYNKVRSSDSHHFEQAHEVYFSTGTELGRVFPEPNLSWSISKHTDKDGPRWRYSREIVWLFGDVDWNKIKHCVQDAVHRTSDPVDLAKIATNLDVNLQKALKRKEESPIFNPEAKGVESGEIG